MTDLLSAHTYVTVLAGGPRSAFILRRLVNDDYQVYYLPSGLVETHPRTSLQPVAPRDRRAILWCDAVMTSDAQPRWRRRCHFPDGRIFQVEAYLTDISDEPQLVASFYSGEHVLFSQVVDDVYRTFIYPVSGDRYIIHVRLR